MNIPRLIGITGRAGSGKDTFADQLVRQHSFLKYSLALPIKELLNARFGWTMEMWNDRKWKEEPALFDWCGDHGDVFISPREMAQWLGTEVGRTIGGQDVWVNLMKSAFVNLMAENANFGMVVADIRFDNEARVIHSLGGIVLRVVRPGQAAVAAHVSERGVSDELVNIEVVNDTDIITFLQNCTQAVTLAPRGV